MKSCAVVRGQWQQQKDGFKNPQKKRKNPQMQTFILNSSLLTLNKKSDSVR